MTSPILLLQRLEAHGLHETALYVSRFSDKHLEQAIHIMPVSKTELGCENLVVTLTPYEVNEGDAEFYYHFKIESTTGRYEPQSFNVLGRSDAQKVFGFLSSQFFY